MQTIFFLLFCKYCYSCCRCRRHIYSTVPEAALILKQQKQNWNSTISPTRDKRAPLNIIIAYTFIHIVAHMFGDNNDDNDKICVMLLSVHFGVSDCIVNVCAVGIVAGITLCCIMESCPSCRRMRKYGAEDTHAAHIYVYFV